jgi:hypothetical protein
LTGDNEQQSTDTRNKEQGTRHKAHHTKLLCRLAVPDLIADLQHR